MSLSQAAQQLKVNRQYLKGYAECLGVQLVRLTPTYTGIRIRDFDLIRRRIEEVRSVAATAGAP